MFVIYTKSVGGRKHDRYFKSWENAKKELLTDLKCMKEQLGWKQTRKLDRMNEDKGFYEFEYNLITEEGEKVVLALIDSYFED
jgi:hypothetical protein